jgi:anti-sigma B factor antagonist
MADVIVSEAAVWESGNGYGRAQPLRLDRSAERDGTTRLRVAGEIDMATVGPLVETMTEILHDPLVRYLVVDLAEVPFLDSSGIHAIVSACLLASDHHDGFELVNCQPNVRRVLEITGVDKMLAGQQG